MVQDHMLLNLESNRYLSDFHISVHVTYLCGVLFSIVTFLVDLYFFL
jgi:hypothetical protein